MNPLQDLLVLVLGDMTDSALTRYLESLGARVSTDIADVDRASFMIDDLGAERLAKQGWSRERIDLINPGLIQVSVTPFGGEGPRSSWKGSELVASAAGGVLRLTGDEDRPPVKEALDACTFHAEMVAAAGAMAAHYQRGRSGRGQHVDVSIQEVALSRNFSGVLMWQFDRRKLHRVGNALNYGKATVRCIWALKDGWCFHSLMSGRFGAPANQALSDWMDESGAENPLQGVDWLSYNRSTLAADIRAEWEKAIAAFFSTRTKAEISSEGRRRGINAAVVAEPEDVLKDEHLKQRGFWNDIAGLKTPSRFVSIRESKHEVQIDAREGERPGPLSGIRVLDFSWALVGSITTKTLGDLGAEVIKVESATRPCLSRIDVQVSASKPDSFDDKPWFAHLNTSKRSLALDMKKPVSREILDPLIKWADVVVENFSPGTMHKLGLDYDSLQKINPAIVMVSGSVYGQTGPLANEWGVDGTGGALSGRTYLTGWPDRDPVIPGSVPYGDVIVPFVMAATVGAALAHRQSQGRGCHIDASMYEICVQQMAPAILASQTGDRPARDGNQDRAIRFQKVVAAKGEDQWVAVTAATQAELDRLQGVLGEDDLDTWCADKRPADVVEIMQRDGIAAGVVQDIEEVLADPQIAARQALIELDHPLLGAFGHLRTPMDFSDGPLQPYRAPGLGEHNLWVAQRIANLDAQNIERLMQAGVFR